MKPLQNAGTVPSAPDQRATVLYVDLGTGRGGSSRSLLFMLRALGNVNWRPLVLVRCGMPMIPEYNALGIEVLEVRHVPAFRPTQHHVIAALLIHFAAYIRFRLADRAVVRTLKTREIAVVHANNESSILFSSYLARMAGAALVSHIRSLLYRSMYGRAFARFIAARSSHLIFITGENRRAFEALLGNPIATPASVLYNIFYASHDTVGDDLGFPRKGEERLRVVTLAHFTPNRGQHRALEIAEALQRIGQEGIVFLLCGEVPYLRIRESGRSEYYQKIVDQIEEKGLAGSVFLPGYVSPPERALRSCDVLLKLGRDNSPWGRDIIEALHLGTPVVALGTYDKFVRDGETGRLFSQYDPDELARCLVDLRDNADKRKAIGRRCEELARELFSPEVVSNALDRIYSASLASR